MCVIRHTVKWNSNSTEIGTALHVPSDHLSPEPGKDNHVPRAKPTAFPQPVQWLACISCRRLFSSLNNWQGIWAALREEDNFTDFWFWSYWRMTDDEKKELEFPNYGKEFSRNVDEMKQWWWIPSTGKYLYTCAHTCCIWIKPDLTHTHTFFPFRGLDKAKWLSRKNSYFQFQHCYLRELGHLAK